MKAWVLPALLTVAVLGYVAGLWTASRGSHPSTPSSSSGLQSVREHPPSAGRPPQKTTTAALSSPSLSPAPPSARAWIISRLSGYLDIEKQYVMLLNVAAQDVNLQREVFELLRATDDPALMEECQILLTGIRDPGLLREVIEAFQKERNPERRLAWGYVLGGTWRQDAVRPVVLDLLDGTDTKLQTRMLGRMWLQSLSSTTPEADRERATSRLRLLVRAGENEALRAAAAGSMRGVQKAEDVAFLIDIMLQDRNPDVQREAFHSLPSNYQSPSPLLEEQTRAMYQAALDDRREARLKKALADRALQNSGGYEVDSKFVRFLSLQERATLRSIAGRDQ